VLQWLTFAIMGWTILAISILIATVLAYYIIGSGNGVFTPYAIASVIVLLPIALALDFVYSKRETEKKTGGTAVVMVIHAVLFALFGVGALVAIVFSVVSVFTGATDAKHAAVTGSSAAVILVLYVAIFLRTIRPNRPRWLHRVAILVLLVVATVTTAIGIAGPIATTGATRS